jgi:hypothetical protein
VPTLRQPAMAGAVRARLDRAARKRASARPEGDLADTEPKCPVPLVHAVTFLTAETTVSRDGSTNSSVTPRAVVGQRNSAADKQSWGEQRSLTSAHVAVDDVYRCAHPVTCIDRRCHAET